MTCDTRHVTHDTFHVSCDTCPGLHKVIILIIRDKGNSNFSRKSCIKCPKKGIFDRTSSCHRKKLL